MTAVPSHRMIEASVPRYTSYPTAPHFHAGVDGATVEAWLDAVPDGENVSLYVHVPFCDRLCWFCACHTRQTLRYDPVAAFLPVLHAEMRMIGARLGGRATVSEIHFGGGSPTMLRPDDMKALRAVIDESFVLSPRLSFSVEIDPNDIDAAKLDALAAIGLTRASLGIQDFDPRVQQAINREQSFERTAFVVEGLRARGVGSVNLDLLYGLPHQTLATLEATIAQSLTLRPDRIALFGYAHVPWFKKHQTMIAEAALPGADERLAQAEAAARQIADAGYVALGIDHFALPDDSLAAALRDGDLRRNFQGYTDDRCETLIGLGPSSISRYRQGHAQNVPSNGEYERRITAGHPATVRGIAFSDDDRARGWVIERLMCDFAFSAAEARLRFGGAANPALSDAVLAVQAGCGLVQEGDRFVVEAESRRLVRTIAARFDTYFAKGNARHSAAV